MSVRHRLVACVTAAALVLAPALAGCGFGGADCVTAEDAVETEPLPAGTLDAGEYSTNLLGTGVSFTLDDTWRAPLSDSENLVLRSPEPPEPSTRAVYLLRGVELLTYAKENVGLRAWLALNPPVAMSNRRETTVGGCDATVVDLTASAEVPLVMSGAGPLLLGPRQVARLWIVEQGQQHPMLILTSVLEGDREWLGTAEAVVDSIELVVAAGPGLEPASWCDPMNPDPGELVGVYTTRDLTLARLSVDEFECALAEEPTPGLVVFELPGNGPAVGFAAPVATADGTPLPDKQAVLDEVAERGGELPERGELELLGRQVTGYADLGEALGVPLALDDDPDGPVVMPGPVDTTYLLDTKRGLLMVSAWGETQEDRAAAATLLEKMAGSLGWAS